MTFSDPKVAEVVNANFVCAWFNRSPGFSNNDPNAEKSIFTQSGEAFLTKNICTFVMAPEGRVFHYVAGYISPEFFLRFLNDALALRRAGFDEKMAVRPGGLEALQRVHTERAAECEKSATLEPEKSAVGDRPYRDAQHVHSAACDWAVRNAWKYLARVHRSWEKAAGTPTLDEVRFKYLYGNDFSEEGPGASPIAADPALARARRCLSR